MGTEGSRGHTLTRTIERYRFAEPAAPAVLEIEFMPVDDLSAAEDRERETVPPPEEIWRALRSSER